MYFSFFGCEFRLTFGFSSYLDVEIGHFSPGPFAAWKRQSEFTGGFFREIFQQVWSWVVEHEASCQGFGKGRATARRRKRRLGVYILVLHLREILPTGGEKGKTVVVIQLV
jgi:hypothetical protein